MADVEVEAEVTTIETETVTLCDMCGLDTADEHIEFHVNPDVEVNVNGEFVKHRFKQQLRGGKYGTMPANDWEIADKMFSHNFYVDLSDAANITSDAELDVCRGCYERDFDAAGDHADHDHLSVTRDDTDTGDDDADEEYATSVTWFEAVLFGMFGIVIVPLTILGWLFGVTHDDEVPMRFYFAGILAALIWGTLLAALFGVIPV